MKKKNWIPSLIAGIILGRIIFVGRLYNQNPVSTQKSEELNQIFALMLNSHTTWQTLAGEAEITLYAPDGSSQKFINQFEFSAPYNAYIESVESGNADNKVIWISDGENYYLLDLKQKQFFKNKIPDFAKDTSKMPNSLDEVSSSESYEYPFSLIISLPIKDYIFPAGFTQGLGNYMVKGEEIILGRETWVVIFTIDNNDTNSNTVVTSTFWVDKETGIILKNIIFRPDYTGGIGSEMSVSKIIINSEVDTKKMRKPAGFEFSPFNQ
jgi:outer membrane lipoprotein-sorting protein